MQDTAAVRSAEPTREAPIAIFSARGHATGAVQRASCAGKSYIAARQGLVTSNRRLEQAVRSPFIGMGDALQVTVTSELDHEQATRRACFDVPVCLRTGITGQHTADQFLDRVLRQAPHARYSMTVGLAEVFQRTARNSGAGFAPSGLERRLHEILDACRVAWPGLGVPEHASVRHLAEHLPEDGDLDDRLAGAVPGSLSRV